MNVEVDVNGIGVSFHLAESMIPRDEDLYKLLRVGDLCEVNDGGVMYKGVVTNIIRLSVGKTLFSVKLDFNPAMDACLFNSCQVRPADPVQCALRLTAMDMLLRRYEPKGKSTNVSIWS